MGDRESSRARPRKRFGQHFLETAWAAKVVAAIAPDPSECFVEIGPGRGALTKILAERAAHVLAIEVDRDLAARLTAERDARVSIVVGDVLQADLVQLARRARQRHAEAAVRLAGNLPYNIASPLLGRLLRLQRGDRPFADATLMLQREVADRMVARPGTRAYGPLALMGALQADVTRLLNLPPGAFRPAPKVRSAVVGLRFRPPEIEVRSVETFEAVVRRVFQQRRKMLANALRPVAVEAEVSVATVLGRAGLDGRRRPESLELADFARLADAVAEAARRPVL